MERSHRILSPARVLGLLIAALAATACEPDEPVFCHATSDVQTSMLCTRGSAAGAEAPVVLEEASHYRVRNAVAETGPSSPAMARKQVFAVRNALGSMLLRTEAPLRAFEPVSLSFSSTPSPPRGKPLDCYWVSDRGIPGQSVFAPDTYEATDSLTGRSTVYQAIAPVALCVPRGDEADWGTSLACYRSASTSSAGSVEVRFLDSTTDVATRTTVGDTLELCLPSYVRADQPDEVRGSFPFLEESDPVASALATLWRDQFRAPDTREEASAAWRARAEAEAVIAGEPDYAADLVLESLQQLSPSDDSGWTSLSPLVSRVVEDRDIRTELALVAMNPPVPRPAGHGDPPPADLVRQQALSLLAEAARTSTASRSVLRGVTTSPDPLVRKRAIRAYLTTARDRHQARRELRPVVREDDRHLLFRP